MSQQETAGSPVQQVVDVKERSTDVKLWGNKKSRPYPRGGRLIKVVRDNKRQEGFAPEIRQGRTARKQERERGLKHQPGLWYNGILSRHLPGFLFLPLFFFLSFRR